MSIAFDPFVSTLDDATLLAAWERSAASPALYRPIILLAAVCPSATWEEIASLPVGERDRRLIRARASAFGAEFAAVATCEKCCERLDAVIHAQDILVSDAPRTTMSVQRDPYRVEVAAPTSADVIAACESDAGDAASAVLNRCIRSAQRDGVAISTSDLPKEVLAYVLQSIAENDPQADVQIALKCPACAFMRTLTFDIASYLWADIEDYVRKLLHEVHTLASAYSWSEHEIVHMGARRRSYYLELVGATA